MSAPDISVLLPVYNDEGTVGRAIESILAQTFEDYELIIIDDGSTDGSDKKIAEYADEPTVRVVAHSSNQGLPTALNTGLEVARGNFVARQDADDRSLPRRLERQHQYLIEHPDVDLVATGVEVVDETGRRTGTFAPPEDPTTEFRSGNPIVHGSVMARRDPLIAVGGYDEFYRFCQDYDLWQRLDAAGRELRGIGNRLYEMRREAGSPTVEQQRIYAIYASLARLPEERAAELKQVAETSNVEAVFPRLPSTERARIHRTIVRASVEHRRRRLAVRSAVRGLRAAPTAPLSHAHLAFAFAPTRLAAIILDQVDGR